MNTKERIILGAESLMLKRGFTALTFKKISENISLQKARIHDFFSTKDELGRAVVEKSRQAFLDWARQIDNSGLEAAEKLSAFFASYTTMLADGNNVCIAGILGTELNHLPDAIRNELRLYYLDRQKWLIKLLLDGYVTGRFSLKNSVEEESIYILSSLQGGLQISRTNDDYEIFHSICRQLLCQLVRQPRAVMFRA